MDTSYATKVANILSSSYYYLRLEREGSCSDEITVGEDP